MNQICELLCLNSRNIFYITPYKFSILLDSGSYFYSLVPSYSLQDNNESLDLARYTPQLH